MTKGKIHSIITIILSVLFLTSFVWTFRTHEENKSLAVRNASLEITVSELLSINEQYQAYYVRVVDSLSSANNSLSKQLIVKNQQLRAISDRANAINSKYISLYESIKVSDDIVDQYNITEQLLAEQQRLIDSQKD